MTARRFAPAWAPQTPSAGRFGAGQSERCVEGPWAESWLKGRKRILDAGFSLSDIGWLRRLLAQDADIHAVDIIAPARVASRYPDDIRARALAVPVTIGDLRQAGLPTAHFDAATCISTVEHIGFDAAGAGPDSAFARWRTLDETPAARDPAVTRDVMAAFARALAPGGLVLVSVPMGKGGAVPIQDSLGFFTRQWEYEARSWRDIAEAPGFRLLEQRFFAWDPTDDGAWFEVESPEDLAHQTAWLTRHAVGVGLAALERAA